MRVSPHFQNTDISLGVAAFRTAGKDVGEEPGFVRGRKDSKKSLFL